MEKAGVDRAWSYRVVYPVVAKTGRILRDGSQLLAYSIIFSYFTFIPSVHADPTGGNITGGVGDINQAGLNTTINQASQNMVIDWQSYNVNVDERVQYIQPNSASISLNRILSNTGSTIAGHIDANGHVILVNPNGVVFTPTAQINVGGIVASGLNISPSDFMNGDYIFNEVLGAEGVVINSGTINASMGGNVAFIGRSVENNGFISANLGSVTLAAGKQAVLTFDNNGLLGVRVSQEILQNELGVDAAVLNNGDINAAGGRVLLTGSVSKDVFSQAVNSGEQAHSVVVNADGTFSLGAGADVVNSGNISVSSTAAAGQIVLLGKNVSSSGELYADVTNGHGGEIELHASDTTLLTENSVTSAIAETSGQGGIVKVLGDKVGLFDQSTVDVSGANGGGQALIGGDYQGKNHYIKNATATVVGNATKINADAKVNGDGGKVILWSDQNTYFYGNIFTRGGLFSGNGGFVEVSGKQNLLFDGFADRTAGNGLDGLLLLDPDDLTIVTGDSNSGTQDNTELSSVDLNVFFTDDSGGDFNITASRLVSVLSSGNVLLQARRDILVNTAITTSSTNTNNLIFQAGDDITLNGGINIGAGDISLTAGVSSCNGSCLSSTSPHDLTINAGLNTTGSIFLNAADSISINQTIGGARTPSSLIVRAGDSIVIDNTSGGANGSITTNGAVSLNASDASLVTDVITVSPNGAITGSISLEGDVATNGGNFTAITTSGYFDNWFDNQNLNVGAGNIIITTNGNATFNVGGSNVTAGAFLGDITTTGSGYLSITTTAGQIIQSTNSAQNLDITGTSAFNAGAHAITLQNTTNDLQGAITLTTTGNNSVVLNNAATTTNFGVVSVGGGLTFNTGLNFGFTNAFNVTGAALLNFGQDNTGRTFTMSSGLSISAGSLSVNGGTGNDIFNIGSSMSGQINGGEGNDVFNINNIGLSIASISGGIGDDTLTAANEANYWNINGSGNSAIYASSADRTATTPTRVNFTGIEAVTGGSGIDDFIVLNPTGLSGLLDGGGASDVLALGTDGVTVQLGSRTLANAVADTNFNVSGVETIYANIGVAVDTLIADNLPNNTWTIGATTSVAGVTFSNFNVLTGGTGVDTFNISADFAGTLNGGITGDTSANAFNFLAGLSSTIFSGTVNGGEGADTFTMTGTDIAFSNLLDGGAGNDTLIAANEVNYWLVSGANAGGIYSDAGRLTNRVDFTSIESLTGNLSTDDFLIGNLGSISQTINGGSGVANTITGRSVASEWDISGSNSGALYFDNNATGFGSAYVTAFNNIATIVGGTLADQFVIGAAGSVTGSVDGGTGSNTLIGRSSDSEWDVYGANSGALYLDNNAAGFGTVYVNVFNNMANITGGSADDQFVMGATGSISGRLDGGTGNNTLVARSSVNNIWSFYAAPGLSTLADAGPIAALPVPPGTVYANFINIQNYIGSGSDSADVSNSGLTTVNVGSYDGFTGLTTSNSSMILTGTNDETFWTVDNANSGYLTWTSHPAQFGFTGFQNLAGGTNTDHFDFTSNGSLSGLINGGTGTDFLDITQLGSTTVNLLNAVATVNNAAGNLTTYQVENINANTLVTNALVGANSTNTWTVSGLHAGSVGGVSFTGFTSLIGALTQSDIFNFNVQPIVAAVTIDGRGNTGDVVSFAALTGQAINVQLGAAYSNIEQIIGNDTDSTLTGSNTNTWIIDGPNDGTVNGIAFFDFNNLVGGNQGDTVAFNTGGSLTGLISGGSGSNVLNVNSTAPTTVQVVNAPPISLNNPVNTLTVYQVGTITGNSNYDHTLVGPDLTTTWNINSLNSGNMNFVQIVGFSGFRNLNGGAANDTFNLTSNSVPELVTGVLSGGNQTTEDVINLVGMTGGAADVVIQLGNAATTGAVDVTGVERITGNNSGTLIASNTVNSWNITGPNDGEINQGTPAQVAFEDFATLQGGADDDTFLVTFNGTLTASIDGGASGVDGDSADYSGQSIVSINFGSVSFNGITGLERVLGNGSNSTLNGPTPSNANDLVVWTVDGLNRGDVTYSGQSLGFSGFNYLMAGNGDDIFTVNNGSLTNVQNGLTGLISGGDGDNTLTVNLSGGGVTYEAIDYVGGAGADSITVNNTSPDAYMATYTPVVTVTDVNSAVNTGSYEQLAYSYSNAGMGIDDSHTLNYRNVETVTTNQLVNTLTILGVDNNIALETIDLQNGLFNVGARTDVAFNNVSNITVNGRGGVDTVAFDALNLTGTLTLTAETVTGNTLTANTLILDNVGQFGASADLITTLIDTLQLINTGDVYINETNGLNLNTSGMVVNGGIFNIAGITSINAGGGSLTLNNAANDFDTVNVNNANVISLVDVDSINGGTIVANSVTLRTAEGIGSDSNLANVGADVNHLQTRTTNLTVANTTSGGVYIDNNQSTTVDIINNGDIEFTNTSGNVIIDRIYTNNGDYPAPVAVGSYTGDAIIHISNGSLAASTANGRTGLVTPDMVAENLTVYVSGGFGSPSRYMSLRVNDTFTFVGVTGYVYYFNGEPRTKIGVDDLFDFSSFASGLFNQQLVEVESVAEIDPAIFTAVRNYNYDDISIRLPSDQLYDDEEEANR